MHMAMTAIPYSLEIGIVGSIRAAMHACQIKVARNAGCPEHIVKRAMSPNLSTKTWSAKLLARWKYLLSFRKSDWELEDYPVIVRKQRDTSVSWGDEVRWTSPAYLARVVNWTALDGSGNTRAEAIADLHERFKNACEGRSAKPRPGTDVPIEFASQERIDARKELVQEFVRDVLGTEWALLTDESSLWHFTLGQSLEEYYTKIMILFGVNVRDVPDGNIAMILDRISAARLESKSDL
jgi:hypothetical protein